MQPKGRRLLGCKVKGRSRLDIRRCADMLRNLIGEMVNKTGFLMEQLLSEGLLHVVADDDPAMRKVDGLYVPEECCILIKDSDYRGIVENNRPRAKFTFWHEFGHMFLGHDTKFARSSSGELVEHKVWEDSEWQANQFAAEVLMPLDEILKLEFVNPVIIADTFGVSLEAASVRYKNLTDYGEI